MAVRSSTKPKTRTPRKKKSGHKDTGAGQQGNRRKQKRVSGQTSGPKKKCSKRMVVSGDSSSDREHAQEEGEDSATAAVSSKDVSAQGKKQELPSSLPALKEPEFDDFIRDRVSTGGKSAVTKIDTKSNDSSVAPRQGEVRARLRAHIQDKIERLQAIEVTRGILPKHPVARLLEEADTVARLTRDAEAIRLQQHAMTVQVEKTGMFLCHVDQFETPGLRILDDLSIQSSEVKHRRTEMRHEGPTW
ncbi:hypothetical protein TI39_contig395g00006 [Zymoseptoria brevis]|uniref:Uncharacterized protein n=1 Tax=Zymoseptoria brevis TaxID=1047168 RepID=A0A0F4GNA6_9PEZI|nr:hypothetical protein TI39_contig395g00006 [Zymoseptoria brevis]